MWRLRAEWNEVKIGATFHRLTVIGQQFRIHAARGKPRWAVVVRCSCGTTKAVIAGDLTRDSQKSCGCWREHIARDHGLRNVKHGFEGSPLYVCWHNIKQRCDNPANASYEDYGARGITYCEQWKRFIPFMRWALANGYREGLQIDRIDNSRNYGPENCRFVTPKRNSRNKRNTAILTAFGETKSMKDWIDDDRCKVPYITLWGRVTGKTKRRWTPEDAVSTPSIPRPERFHVN